MYHKNLKNMQILLFFFNFLFINVETTHLLSLYEENVSNEVILSFNDSHK